MKILFASSECTHLASTGGLGDVGNALPLALTEQGLSVDRIMPLYQEVKESSIDIQSSGIAFDVLMGDRSYPVEIWETVGQEPRTWLVRQDELFDRPDLYGHADNDRRFILFQKAAVALIDHLGCPYDLVHLNDWQTGLIPLFLEHGTEGQGRSKKERSVMTIHNLAFQGDFSPESYALTNLPEAVYSDVEIYGRFNSLKGGLLRADKITTVSSTYAEEIQADPLGCGLDALLRDRRGDLLGIVNGVDYSSWSPETDEALPANYSKDDLAGKAICRTALLKEVGLQAADDQPVLGMISRLSGQKGLELFEDALPRMLETGARFVLLGSGEKMWHAQATSWVARWPDQVAAVLRFDQGLAHRIEAGADMFLMPSCYEPCGLNQLYSLKYGTVPVVNPTGGLEDTIVDASLPDGTGFKLAAYTSEAFADSVVRAIAHFRDDPAGWKALQQRGMARDYSWKVSAEIYIEVYRGLLGGAA